MHQEAALSAQAYSFIEWHRFVQSLPLSKSAALQCVNHGLRMLLAHLCIAEVFPIHRKPNLCGNIFQIEEPILSFTPGCLKRNARLERRCNAVERNASFCADFAPNIHHRPIGSCNFGDRQAVYANLTDCSGCGKVLLDGLLIYHSASWPCSSVVDTTPSCVTANASAESAPYMMSSYACPFR